MTNAFASAMLGRGFELLRADVATAEPELAFGWNLSRSGRSLVLTDPDGTVLYSSASDDASRWWETLAASEGQVLVVAGTDLGMAPDGNPGPTRLEEAVRAGRVVVARVRFSG